MILVMESDVDQLIQMLGDVHTFTGYDLARYYRDRLQLAREGYPAGKSVVEANLQVPVHVFGPSPHPPTFTCPVCLSPCHSATVSHNGGDIVLKEKIRDTGEGVGKVGGVGGQGTGQRGSGPVAWVDAEDPTIGSGPGRPSPETVCRPTPEPEDGPEDPGEGL